ncbi:MAG: penicillin-binding transpeptidase domain-containing protein, partial [Gammaproteobacteria bacterium]
LEAGYVTPTTVIDTSPGLMRIGSWTVQDPRDFGRIDVTSVLTKSSNVGAAKIALALEPEQIWDVLYRFGVGQLTDSSFPGESAGQLNHYEHWRTIGQATLAFGYGVTVTSLQLAQAYATIASGGLRMPVSLLALNEARAPQRVVTPETAAQLVAMLETVVTPEGTGNAAAVSGYRIAGKTGTARKAVSGGYADDRHTAVFAGLAPASRPRLVTVVVIDEPEGERYHGGDVAAPVFARVISGALRLLGIPPDAVDEVSSTQLVQMAVIQ